MEGTLRERGEEVLDILRSDTGYVYVAGRVNILETLENIRVVHYVPEKSG